MCEREGRHKLWEGDMTQAEIQSSQLQPHTGYAPSDPETPSLTSSSLLLGLKAQERMAWVRLVRLYAPLVYYWCRQAGLQAADAADLGQEVFVAVARRIAEYR